MSGFDEISRRFRPVEHDTWGRIGSLHKAAQRPPVMVCEVDPEEGGSCNKPGCLGTYDMAYPDGGCSCHIHPPCGRCTSSYLVCAVCQYQPDEEAAP